MTTPLQPLLQARRARAQAARTACESGRGHCRVLEAAVDAAASTLEGFETARRERERRSFHAQVGRTLRFEALAREQLRPPQFHAERDRLAHLLQDKRTALTSAQDTLRTATGHLRDAERGVLKLEAAEQIVLVAERREQQRVQEQVDEAAQETLCASTR